MDLLFPVLRIVVFGAFVAASAVALTDWAVRNRHLPPFGGLPLFMRRVSSPLLKPLSARMVKSGHNPVDAPMWLFWIVLLGGLAVLGLAQWLIGEIAAISWAIQSGANGILAFAFETAYSLLTLALLIRVVGSWFGVSPYAKWMKPVMVLTNWIVEPIRKLLPPTGMIDFSPFVAYLLLYVAHIIVIRAL